MNPSPLFAEARASSYNHVQLFTNKTLVFRIDNKSRSDVILNIFDIVIARKELMKLCCQMV